MSTPTEAYQALYDSVVPEFLEVSALIGPSVSTLSPHVEAAFRAPLDIIAFAAEHERSDENVQTGLVPHMTLISEAVEELNGSRDSRSLGYNHQSALALFIPLALWPGRRGSSPGGPPAPRYTVPWKSRAVSGLANSWS